MHSPKARAVIAKANQELEDLRQQLELSEYWRKVYEGAVKLLGAKCDELQDELKKLNK